MKAFDVRTILIPLDGSPLAERALPVAEHLALATGSALVLAYVTPVLTWAFAVPGGWASPNMYQELLDAEDREALGYIVHTAHTIESHGVQVQTLTVRGDPASVLLDIVAQSGVDLVVMTTHGRTGLERFTLGSVADRLVRAGSAPVLLLRSFDDVGGSPTLENALVPLDGSRLSESALDMVVTLAGNTIRRVTLARVVHPNSSASATAEAQRYLDDQCSGVQAQLGETGCLCATKVVRGRVAESLIGMEHDCDIVVMATHGRSGATRWALGSNADRLLQGLHIPLLLVTPRHAAEQRRRV